MNRIAEVLDPGRVPIWRQPVWSERLPWVIQGTTGRGGADDEMDFGFFGESPVGTVVARWRMLREITGTTASVHSRQIHEAGIADWATPLPDGMLLTEGSDAHLTGSEGMLLAVSVADCVPVFIAETSTRRVAIAHAGWRGVAAGIIEATLARLASQSSAEDIWLHCGPAICGECYEVGAEVHAAIRPGVEHTTGRSPIDLRAAIVERAQVLGVRPDRVSVSSHCTRCGPGDFFSHRGGSAGRQIGFVGIRSGFGPGLH